jgi:hypothetical protein
VDAETRLLIEQLIAQMRRSAKRRSQVNSDLVQYWATELEVLLQSIQKDEAKSGR